MKKYSMCHVTEYTLHDMPITPTRADILLSISCIMATNPSTITETDTGRAAVPVVSP